MDGGFLRKDDGEMMEIVLRQKTKDREAHIHAMWLLFLFAPSKAIPEPDGFFNLGEIGSDANKNWSRVTPYSPAEVPPRPSQENDDGQRAVMPGTLYDIGRPAV
jgi:hypothetical protein